MNWVISLISLLFLFASSIWSSDISCQSSIFTSIYCQQQHYRAAIGFKTAFAIWFSSLKFVLLFSLKNFCFYQLLYLCFLLSKISEQTRGINMLSLQSYPNIGWPFKSCSLFCLSKLWNKLNFCANSTSNLCCSSS